MYAVTRHIFITFPISKELYLFFKKNGQTRLFKLYEALFIYKNLAADDYAYLGWGWSKIWLFRTRADFSVIINISIKTLWPRAIFMLFLPFLYFQFLSSYNGFSLFSLHDQYLLMFKDSNVFGFTNFSSQTKYNNTAAFSVNSNYLFSRRKQDKKLLKQFFD